MSDDRCADLVTLCLYYGQDSERNTCCNRPSMGLHLGRGDHYRQREPPDVPYCTYQVLFPPISGPKACSQKTRSFVISGDRMEIDQ
eukprot:133893-Pleurochrysis_carterae.AAC.1